MSILPQHLQQQGARLCTGSQYSKPVNKGRPPFVPVPIHSLAVQSSPAVQPYVLSGQLAPMLPGLSDSIIEQTCSEESYYHILYTIYRFNLLCCLTQLLEQSPPPLDVNPLPSAFHLLRLPKGHTIFENLI